MRTPLPPLAAPPSPAARAGDGGPAAGSVRRAAARGAAGAGRDPYFDNAKYLAIVLVAAAHSWEPFWDDSRAATALYLFVYTFHMPAFIMISGYFSRGFTFTPSRVRRLVAGVAVPYVVFQTAYALFRRWAHDEPDYPIDLFDPWFVMWFLLALFFWRLLTPVWERLRWPVTTSVVIAVLVSVSPSVGGELELQRVLRFLPFFVIGLTLRPEHFTLVRHRAARLLSLPVLLGALVFSYWAAPRMNHQWLFLRDPAQDLGVSAVTGAAMSLALLVCSLVLSACFLAWVPGRRLWCTALGAGTLYGFLLHGFLVKGSRWWGWYRPEWVHTPLGMVAVTLLASAAVTLLCTPAVRRALRAVVEPRMDWLFPRGPGRP
ncbi:acyltransferase family protein [Streptomyces albus subsp. chlorinus]|uniref:acyltransferase family protein n=1 Tax=Streptomyces albus TaxID=1888 RepID=UPI00157068DE|nr:acyltransferase family protein [Streptomyces albus]NSC23859.1 acyltransferase family protein [Streptomyces albus subsp. chlorinus]